MALDLKSCSFFDHERCSSINKPRHLAASTIWIDITVDHDINMIIRKSIRVDLTQLP